MPSSAWIHLFSMTFEKQKLVDSHFTCCHLNTSCECFVQINSQTFTTPSALNWHLWHYVTPKCKTGLTWWATLIVCIICMQLNLSLSSSTGLWRHASAQAGVCKPPTKAHKYLILQGILRMHSYESLHWKSCCAVSAIKNSCWADVVRGKWKRKERSIYFLS